MDANCRWRLNDIRWRTVVNSRPRHTGESEELVKLAKDVLVRSQVLWWGEKKKFLQKIEMSSDAELFKRCTLAIMQNKGYKIDGTAWITRLQQNSTKNMPSFLRLLFKVEPCFQKTYPTGGVIHYSETCSKKKRPAASYRSRSGQLRDCQRCTPGHRPDYREAVLRCLKREGAVPDHVALGAQPHFELLDWCAMCYTAINKGQKSCHYGRSDCEAGLDS